MPCVWGVCGVALNSLPRVIFAAAWFDLDTEHNRWVYVSGLPSTITVDEFIELMSKYGVVMEDEKGELLVWRVGLACQFYCLSIVLGGSYGNN